MHSGPPDSPASLDPREFRSTLALFATGVAVIAVEADDQVHAMTANAVSSLSLDPMLVLFCPSKKARIKQHLDRTLRFTINFLREDQQALSTFFAGAWKHPQPPSFGFLPSSCGPRLEHGLASLGCESRSVVDAGDHWLIIGRVIELHRGVEPHRPLVFFQGNYRSLDERIATAAPDLVSAAGNPSAFYERWILHEY